MNKHSKQLSLYLLLSLLGTITAIALRTAACFTELDYAHGHFDGKGLITSANVIIIALCVFSFSYLFFGHVQKLRATFSTPQTYVPSGLVSLCLVLLCVQLFIYGADVIRHFSVQTDASYKLQAAISILSALAALPAAFHFFLNGYLTERKNQARALFSLFTIVFFAFYAAFLHFDTSLPLNAPNKIVDQLAFLSCGLFFLYEARISLGTEVWRGYIAFGLIAAQLSAYSSVPSIILYFANGQVISMCTEENLLMLATCIFISMRLCLLLFLRSEDDDGGVSILSNYALERQQHILDAEAVYSDAFATQMTIDDLTDFDTIMLCETEQSTDSSNEDASEIDEDYNQLQLQMFYDEDLGAANPYDKEDENI